MKHFFFTCLEDNADKGLHEFVSDMLQVSSEDLVEVREGMKRLALGSKANGKICVFACECDLLFNIWNCCIEKG